MEIALGSHAEEAELERRIHRMHSRDKAGLVLFVIALWITLLFTLFSIWSFITVPTIKTILMISGGFVLLLNTAAIVAMLRHYSEDRHFIYGLDLKHLDEMRKRRG
ncbi:hypothetical protein [Pseudaminobacter sp. NGMCC 1.201702]|uniref:hypothetical protein n=1 Tax=Pseudaminobacter sp. NGMCC 1.201702 TaxID=3391825 RepID=UPI0039F0CD28